MVKLNKEMQESLVFSMYWGFLITLAIIVYLVVMLTLSTLPVIGGYIVALMVGFPMASATVYLMKKTG